MASRKGSYRKTLGPVMMGYLTTIYQTPHLNISEVLRSHDRQSWPKDRAPIRRLIDYGWVENKADGKQYDLVATQQGREILLESWLQFSDAPEWVFMDAMDCGGKVRNLALAHVNCPPKLQVVAQLEQDASRTYV